jgi:ribose 5-phosphate isomerase B
VRVGDKPIAVGSDDVGFGLKESIKRYLEEQGRAVADYGCDSPDPVDTPDVALAVARPVARGEHDRAILVCGTGIGMAIAATRMPGV